jgi:hypothetical protein
VSALMESVVIARVVFDIFVDDRTVKRFVVFPISICETNFC